MKKAFLLALLVILAGLLAVNGTFAMPDLNDVFANLTKIFGDALGLPEAGGETVNVALVCESDTQLIYPGGAARHTASVHNEGTGAVYFRLAYAVQYDAETWDQLEITFDHEDGFLQDDCWREITVGSTPYRMMVFTFTKALPAGADSPKVQMTVAMDERITSRQLSRYRADFLQIQALAIDPTPFVDKGYPTAKEALDMALPLDTLNPF